MRCDSRQLTAQSCLKRRLLYSTLQLTQKFVLSLCWYHHLYFYSTPSFFSRETVVQALAFSRAAGFLVPMMQCTAMRNATTDGLQQHNMWSKPCLSHAFEMFAAAKLFDNSSIYLQLVLWPFYSHNHKLLDVQGVEVCQSLQCANRVVLLRQYHVDRNLKGAV